MFSSFFPNPKLFFPAAVLWTALSMALWYGFARDLRPRLSLGGLVGWLLPHRWFRWSVGVSAVRIFFIWFQVQLDVMINNWFGTFYNMVQQALGKPGAVTQEQFFGQLATFAGIALIAITVAVCVNFIVSHYIFRWRTAM